MLDEGVDLAFEIAGRRKRKMMTKTKNSREPTVVEAHDPSSLPGKLKAIGGSKSDIWNNVIANQTIQAL